MSSLQHNENFNNDLFATRRNDLQTLESPEIVYHLGALKLGRLRRKIDEQKQNHSQNVYIYLDFP